MPDRHNKHHGLDWKLPYAVARNPAVGDRAVVASHPLAAQAGLSMMAAGGNAVDAAVAAAAVIAVVEPTNNGLGSDAFALVDDGQTVHGVNGTGRAPLAWQPSDIDRLAAIGPRGWDSVTTPGAVSVWMALAQRHASLPFAQLMAPAIRYARDGFPVSPGVARKWAEQAPTLAMHPGFAEVFLPAGQAPQPGERVRFPQIAGTLERLADTQGHDFYTGRTAASLHEHAVQTGGLLRREDLAAHQAEWVSPLQLRYRDWWVHEMPPNGQGLVVLMALGILQHTPVAREDVDSAAWVHWQVEALKLAFADAGRYLADPATMAVTPAQLLNDTYLRSRAQAIDPQRAGTFEPGMPALSGTVYLAAGDDRGLMVSLIQSNYMGFGSGVVDPRTGVSLQNRGACFSLDAGHANRLAPGKRPAHTILPGMARRLDGVRMAFGSTGGIFQPQGHVQLMVRLADQTQNPQAIVDAPRFRVDARGAVSLEPHAAPALADGLARLGHGVHPMTSSTWDFGGMQILYRLGDTYVVASDPRRDSLAAVC